MNNKGDQFDEGKKALLIEVQSDVRIAKKKKRKEIRIASENMIQGEDSQLKEMTAHRLWGTHPLLDLQT